MNTYQTPNQNKSNFQEKVFVKMLRAGGKNYFFDVKKASNGSNYLTVAQSYKNQKGEQFTNRLMLFKDQFQDFFNALQEAGAFLK